MLQSVKPNGISPSAQGVPIIPLDKLLGNPSFVSPLVSPDGKTLAWIAPSKENDVLNVWVRSLGAECKGDRMVTSDAHRGIRIFLWAEDSQSILYLQVSMTHGQGPWWWG